MVCIGLLPAPVILGDEVAAAWVWLPTVKEWRWCKALQHRGGLITRYLGMEDHGQVPRAPDLEDLRSQPAEGCRVSRLFKVCWRSCLTWALSLCSPPLLPPVPGRPI